MWDTDEKRYRTQRDNGMCMTKSLVKMKSQTASGKQQSPTTMEFEHPEIPTGMTRKSDETSGFDRKAGDEQVNAESR